MAGHREASNEPDTSCEASGALSALERLQAKPLMLWLAVIGATLLAFYVMDHLIMLGQGLPLNIDLSPSQ